MKTKTAIRFDGSCVKAAWEQHETELLNYLKTRVDEASIAEDILQDIFVKAMLEGRRFCELDNVRAWLFRVVKNRLIDIYRTQKSYQYILDEVNRFDLNRDQELPEIFVDLSQCLPRVLTELPKQESHILRLCSLEGVTQREYASRQGLSLTATKSRLLRARNKLRHHLKSACQVNTDRHGKVCCFTPRKSFSNQ